MRRRALSVAAVVALVAATGAALSAPATSVSGARAAPSAGPSANAVAPSAAPTLPAGHPAVAPKERADGSFEPPPDNVTASADVPAGSIVARIVDREERPSAGRDVKLGILKQSIAQGDSHDERHATTDADGTVHFDGLTVGSSFSYRMTVVEGPATYAAAPFSLQEGLGQRVLLHVYPVTRDINRALVGLRGVVYVEPRDDVFQFEVMFSVFNVGKTTWVPDGVSVQLPPGWKAFSTQEAMSDTRFIADGDTGVKLEGTFSPGQHEVNFRFQVPNEHGERASFALHLPPHVADLRVMIEAGREMAMEVEGRGRRDSGESVSLPFSRAEPTQNQRGQRILVTQKQLHQGDPELAEAALTISGMPTYGPGRWVAVAIALGLAAAGVARSMFRSPPASSGKKARGGGSSREALLSELVELERARAAGEIGPNTYRQARESLVVSLLALEEQRVQRA